jgi:Bacterial type II and III secretion system protein/Bacterial type II/III secretion system short domain
MTSLLRFLIFLIIFFWFGLCIGASEMILRVYELKHTGVEKIIPVINGLIETDEKVEALNNRIIIHASPETQKKIAGLIEKIDIPRSTLLIRVRHSSNGITNAIRTGNHVPKARAKTSGHLGNSQKSTTQKILVQDGAEAFIVKGEDIPYSSELAMVSGRHQGFSRNITYKEVRTGFRVRPTLQGKMVEVELVPFKENIRGNSSPNVDNPPYVSYQKAGTKFRVQLNSWFELAGTAQNTRQDDVSTVRWRTGKNYHNSSIWIKIEDPSSTVSGQ